jgi:hypothetical protein
MAFSVDGSGQGRGMARSICLGVRKLKKKRVDMLLHTTV